MPKSRNLKPKPDSHKPMPQTQTLYPEKLIHETQTLYPKPETQTKPKPYAQKQKPETLTPQSPKTGCVIQCKATWKREFKLPCHEAGPPHHHDDEVDSDR